jgi:hypothetical protein
MCDSHHKNTAIEEPPAAEITELERLQIHVQILLAANDALANALDDERQRSFRLMRYNQALLAAIENGREPAQPLHEELRFLFRSRG